MIAGLPRSFFTPDECIEITVMPGIDPNIRQIVGATTREWAATIIPADPDEEQTHVLSEASAAWETSSPTNAHPVAVTLSRDQLAILSHDAQLEAERLERNFTDPERLHRASVIIGYYAHQMGANREEFKSRLADTVAEGQLATIAAAHYIANTIGEYLHDYGAPNQPM